MFTTVLEGWLDALVLTSRQRSGRWSASQRSEVFPPPTHPPPAPYRRHEHAAVREARLASGLRTIQAEFTQALDDIQTQESGAVFERIRAARSLHELWHLRADVFRLVSHHRDQLEADRRLARLNRHFPTRGAHPAMNRRERAPHGG